MKLDEGEYFLRFYYFVDDMLIKLSNHGCSMFGHPLGALMYADNLVLLAPTIHELQRALKLCAVEIKEIGFKINYSIAVVLRIVKNEDTLRNEDTIVVQLQ